MMARKRNRGEMLFDYALLVISVGVILLSSAIFFLIFQEVSVSGRFFGVPFALFVALFLLGLTGIRLWRKETR